MEYPIHGAASLVMIVEEAFNFDDTRAFFALAN